MEQDQVNSNQEGPMNDPMAGHMSRTIEALDLAVEKHRLVD